MATYVVSDIHGQYDMFMDLMKKIQLKESDTLYILGDVLDRGPYPIKTLRELMKMPNAVCIVGNHEIMAIECLRFLTTEITMESITKLDEKVMDNLLTWHMNGSETTIEEFGALDPDEQEAVIDYIKEFLIYEEVTVNDSNYLLVHGGLGNYDPDREVWDYSVRDLVWERADYSIKYFEDTYVVTGHTPTQSIEDNPRPGYIYRNNNHIAIDCGCCRKGGRLAAICLDTGEEFYSPE
jgi:serine/threonine protein phosphatase 1